MEADLVENWSKEELILVYTILPLQDAMEADLVENWSKGNPN